MSEVKTLSNLNINKGLTKQQLIDSSITEDEISFVEDDSVIDVPAPTQAGKVLKSTADGAEWSDGGAGAVDSVNGKTGAVILTAEDVKATPQVEEMPDASANVGKVVQYVGEDGQYKKGSMYISITKTTEDNLDVTWDGTGLGNVTVDLETFKSKVQGSGTYIIELSGGTGAWLMSGVGVIDLAEYGISIETTPDYQIQQTGGATLFDFWLNNPERIDESIIPDGSELEFRITRAFVLDNGEAYFFVSEHSTEDSYFMKWECYYDESGQWADTKTIYTSGSWEVGDQVYSDQELTIPYSTVQEITVWGENQWHNLSLRPGIALSSDLDAGLDYVFVHNALVTVYENPENMKIKITDSDSYYYSIAMAESYTQRKFVYMGDDVWDVYVPYVEEYLGTYSMYDLQNCGIKISGRARGDFSLQCEANIGVGTRITLTKVEGVQPGARINIDFTKGSTTSEWKALGGGSSTSTGINWDKSVTALAYSGTQLPVVNLGRLGTGEYEMFYSRKGLPLGRTLRPDLLYKLRFNIDINGNIRGFVSRIIGENSDAFGEMYPPYAMYMTIGKNWQDECYYLGSNYWDAWSVDNGFDYDLENAFRISTIKNVDTGEETSGEAYLSPDNMMFNELSAFFVTTGDIFNNPMVQIPEPIRSYAAGNVWVDEATRGFMVRLATILDNEHTPQIGRMPNSDVKVSIHSEDKEDVFMATIHLNPDLTCEIKKATGIMSNLRPVLYDLYNNGDLWSLHIAFIDPEANYMKHNMYFSGTSWEDAEGQERYVETLHVANYSESQILQEIPVVSPAGGAVDSVNGKTGAVVLDGEDISADVDELPNTVQGHLQSMSDKIKDIELVKVPNATIVGNPTINHGQVSGFTSDDYLQFPFELDVQNRHLKVNFCFTTGEDVTTQQNVLDSYFGLALAIANGKGLMAVSHNGTSWASQVVGSVDILPNTTYFARLTWNGILYKTELSTDGSEFTSDMTFGSTQPPFPRTMFIGGSPDLFGAGSAHPFKGSINLNYANVEIDDNDIWEGMDDVGLGTRLDVNVSNISDEGKEKLKQIVGIGDINAVLDAINGENI